MKCSKYILICLCAALHGAAAWGQEDIPAAFYQRALAMIQSAQNKQLQKENSTAQGQYRLAERNLRVLQKRYPDYKPSEIAAQVTACQEKIAALEDESQQLPPKLPDKLPEGCIRVLPGMSRGGTRYGKGQLLASKVKKVSDGEYEVGKYTVRITRAGSKIGASCTCPDFLYNSLGKGDACKHIWAIIIKEGLL
ncbi:MAG: SWIM zinc finger family protein [Candidatus Tritonobacter lacicola]|nr:SWIM zinc finger family protein [Candidatus Tritonobacter lacicola]